MKIAIAATYDVTDVNKWSGTAYYIYQLLKKHFEVTPINVSFKRSWASLLRGFYYNRLTNKQYFTTFDFSVYKHSKDHLDNVFAGGYDVIFTYDYFLIPSLVKYAKHIILISDATFDNLLNYYDYRSNLCPRNIKDGHALQKEAFEKLTYALFSSNWAISNAVEKYGANRSKLKTLFYGSNLNHSLRRESISGIVKKREEEECVNLFLPAVNWERKGGDFALAVVDKLNEQGVNSKLIVAGCKVPEYLNKKNIIDVGFLDKRNSEQEKKLIEWYQDSHFLIMPTKADCTPIVFSEANSFALPIITSITGGTQTIVNRENNNGAAFELKENFVEEAVKYIVSTLEDKEGYTEMCFNSYDTYQNKLNWAIGEKVIVDLVHSLNYEAKIHEY